VSISTLLLLALGLSMDAFGASVSRGASFGAFARPWSVLGASLLFGAFATVAPLVGWALGRAFYSLIEAYDHWIAFALLSLIGAKMIRDGLTHEVPRPIEQGYRLVVLVVAATATSIDAVAVGLTLPAFRVNILIAAGVIGAVTFTAALGGAAVGRLAGDLVGRRAEIAGGILLIAIGVKIVLEHTLVGARAG
jgi:putative Mn2+ efflux pump MntP